LQKGQGTQGHRRKDHTTNTRKVPNVCGEQGKKGANGPKEDERVNQSKRGGMGMMGGWMELGT
jgi:hypothetical protein